MDAVGQKCATHVQPGINQKQQLSCISAVFIICVLTTNLVL